MSGTTHSTSTVVLFTNIAILMDFHHDRIKDNLERVVTHFYGFAQLL
jgi:hypothetical protein